MNDEIKEILKLLKRCDNTYLKIENTNGKTEYEYKKVNDLRLDGYHSQLLLDYITNLQEELEEEKRIEQKDLELINDYEDKITNLHQEKDKQYEDNLTLAQEITNLQEENESLKNKLNCKEYFSSTMPENTEFVILTKNNYDRQQRDIELELIDYKSRIEKAVEYINKHCVNEKVSKEVGYKCYTMADTNELEKIIKILNGGKDE